MKIRVSFSVYFRVALSVVLLAANHVSAETATSAGALANADRIAELERQVRVLTDEVERARMDTAVPAELESAYGYGPAASKVYSAASGLSIGGYGEAYYSAYVGDKGNKENKSDFLRAVLYFGYKFTDSIIFNSEIEIEHADKIFLEFATLDFMLKDYANIKAGLMLLPIGWLNEYHEPPFFFGVNRPQVEKYIIPTTWRANGVGLFGNFGEKVHYKLYAVNSLNGENFTAAGLRDGRQKGSKALTEDIAVTGRLDFTPLPGMILGASFFVGDTGQNQTDSTTGIKLPNAQLTLFDVHAQWQWKNLWLRGLYTMAFVDNAAELSAANGLAATDNVAQTMLGGYAEIAYNIWGFLAESERSLQPFYRFEYYDTQFNVPTGAIRDKQDAVVSHTVGVQFEPIPNVVLKADYRNLTPAKGKLGDTFNLGVGYVF